MEPIEVSGKKIGDALKEGLRLLGTTLDKVDYKVISPGGLFKKAKISIKIVEDEDVTKAESKSSLTQEKASYKEQSKERQQPRELNRETSKELNRETSKQNRDASKETATNQNRQQNREQPKDTNKQQSREQNREQNNDTSKQQNREQNRETNREQNNDTSKQQNREQNRETNREQNREQNRQQNKEQAENREEGRVQREKSRLAQSTEGKRAGQSFAGRQQGRYADKDSKQGRASSQTSRNRANDNDTRRNRDSGEKRVAEVKKRVRTQDISESDVARAVEFAKELLTRMGYDIEIQSRVEEGDIIIDLVNDTGALIGYRGETLDAIEYLISINTNRDTEEYINVVVDSCGYRQKREKMLVAMAENAAKRCIKMGRKVIMEPMNRSSRKVVHSTLSSYDNIFTKSEGTEPNRHIVLFYKRDNK